MIGGGFRSEGATGRFGKGDRLLKSREFRHVSRQGRRAASSAYVVLVAEGRGQAPRLGLTVSRKVGNAVVRNRVKRRIREWFREAREGWPAGTELVVIARREAATLPFAESCQRLSAQVARAMPS